MASIAAMSDWFRIGNRASSGKVDRGGAGPPTGESPPWAGRLRDAALQRKHLFEPRPVADRQLEHVEEPAGRELGVDEVVGQDGPPLIETCPVKHVVAGQLGGVEQVSVSVMLVLLTPGIAPVVEDLAAEQMPADAPGVAVALRHQDLLAHLH